MECLPSFIDAVYSQISSLKFIAWKNSLPAAFSVSAEKDGEEEERVEISRELLLLSLH